MHIKSTRGTLILRHTAKQKQAKKKERTLHSTKKTLEKEGPHSKKNPKNGDKRRVAEKEELGGSHSLAKTTGVKESRRGGADKHSLQRSGWGSRVVK